VVAKITTVSFQGITVLPVDVQIQISQGLPAFLIVGLPDKAVTESRERVRGALHALGLSLPAKRITVNLAPADQLKEGSHFDLAIALALLAALEILPAHELNHYVALGEIGLDARILPVSGVLPSALFAAGEHLGIICPAQSSQEASWARTEYGDLPIIPAENLLELIAHFKGDHLLTTPEITLQKQPQNNLDLADVRGQDLAKRALIIAAAGGHNLLLCGPPGSGKSMLAARLPNLLPPLTPSQALEVSMIHSVAGLLKGGNLLMEPPYRDPHHSASLPALVGGGNRAKPGEISLAHHGVLFLDELPEFSRPVLEALRQPLETGKVTVARANHHVSYPAAFQLIAAMNPCRCGHADDPDLACHRTPHCIRQYQDRISGPIFDRIDLYVETIAVSPLSLHHTSPPAQETRDTAPLIARCRAYQAQRARKYKLPSEQHINAYLQGQALAELTQLEREGERLLTQAVEKWKLSARAFHRVLRVARTIADLEEEPQIKRHHLAEALGFRRMIRSV